MSRIRNQPGSVPAAKPPLSRCMGLLLLLVVATLQFQTVQAIRAPSGQRKSVVTGERQLSERRIGLDGTNRRDRNNRQGGEEEEDEEVIIQNADEGEDEDPDGLGLRDPGETDVDVVIDDLGSAGKVECGGTVTVDTKLQEDLICDCPRGDEETFVALTLVGPAKLNLNGHTVACDDNEFNYYDMGSVIKIIGRGAKLKNGVVAGGNFGIWINGEGRHTVKNMVVTGTGDDSILITGVRNTVKDCIIEDCGQGPDANNNGDCIDIEAVSSRTTIKNNQILNFGDDGIDIDGSDNLIQNNIIKGDSGKTSESGIAVRGTGNKIYDNDISGMYGVGIDMKYDNNEDCSDLHGGGHHVTGNVIHGSREGRGISIQSDSNTVEFNDVFSNEKDGIRVDTSNECANGAQHNSVCDNQSYANKGDGLHIEGSNNYVARNTAEDNAEDGLKNRGRSNTFEDNKAFDNGDEDFDWSRR